MTKQTTPGQEPKFEPTTEDNFVDKCIAYEEGTMTSEEEIVDFFQHIIDTHKYRWLQGFYGRTARDLIEAGLCTPPRN